jgi:hypothetical protein
MKLFKRNSKAQRFDIIPGDLSRAHLGNIVAVSKYFTSMASLIKGVTDEDLSINSTHRASKAILCPRNIDVDHVSGVLNNLGR